jgi:mannose-6-phosphate isomerase-like protein (cupin superfamily)
MSERVDRKWGYYKVLHQGDGFTVKELTIFPGKTLSDQRHFNRSEHWLVIKGTLHIDYQRPGLPPTKMVSDGILPIYIPQGCWHRPHNLGRENVVVIETWLGDSSEDDIERRRMFD